DARLVVRAVARRQDGGVRAVAEAPDPPVDPVDAVAGELDERADADAAPRAAAARPVLGGVERTPEVGGHRADVHRTPAGVDLRLASGDPDAFDVRDTGAGDSPWCARVPARAGRGDVLHPLTRPHHPVPGSLCDPVRV